MSKEMITLDYPFSCADFECLEEGDKVMITWLSTPELKSSASLIGKVERFDTGTMRVCVNAPWVSAIGLTWCIAGTLGVAGIINRPGTKVTIPKPEPLQATAGAVLLGPEGEVAIFVARVTDEAPTIRSQWIIVNPYFGKVKYMPHEDSWMLRSWKLLTPPEVERVEDDEEDPYSTLDF